MSDASPCTKVLWSSCNLTELQQQPQPLQHEWPGKLARRSFSHTQQCIYSFCRSCLTAALTSAQLHIGQASPAQAFSSRPSSTTEFIALSSSLRAVVH